jgi:hypothetical protein
MDVVLLSRVVCFAGKGGGGGIVVPEGVAIAGVPAGRGAGAIITIVTLSPSGRRGGGTVPHLGGNGTGGPLCSPLPPPAACPPGSGPGIWDGPPAAHCHNNRPLLCPPPHLPRQSRTKGRRAWRGTAMPSPPPHWRPRSSPPH